jgi:hemerythrin-like domain-containing protein
MEHSRTVEFHEEMKTIYSSIVVGQVLHAKDTQNVFNKIIKETFPSREKPRYKMHTEHTKTGRNKITKPLCNIL